MSDKKLLKYSLLFFSFFSLLTLLSVLFIDRDLAILISNYHIDSIAERYYLRYFSEGLPIILPIFYILFIMMAEPEKELGNKTWFVIYLILLTKIVLYVKYLLKIAFGRYWIKSWIGDNLSLIHDGVFGFNWFHGYANHGSFPSGHTSFVTITALSLLIVYPRFFWLWVSLILITIIDLIALDYHFLGDCFAALAISSLFSYLGFFIYQTIYAKINN